MPGIVTKIETGDCLRELLEKEGYKLSSKKGLGKLGPDIKATRDDKTWYIEVIGFEGSGIERVNDFYQAFFRAVSRLNNKDCRHIIIAIPEKSRKILPKRAKIYKVAWKRIGEIFPELEIWLVDTIDKKYQRTSWLYWLDRNK
jgi:hypothetical protein